MVMVVVLTMVVMRDVKGDDGNDAADVDCVSLMIMILQPSLLMMVVVVLIMVMSLMMAIMLVIMMVSMILMRMLLLL